MAYVHEELYASLIDFLLLKMLSHEASGFHTSLDIFVHAPAQKKQDNDIDTESPFRGIPSRMHHYCQHSLAADGAKGQCPHAYLVFTHRKILKKEAVACHSLCHPWASVDAVFIFYMLIVQSLYAEFDSKEVLLIRQFDAFSHIHHSLKYLIAVRKITHMHSLSFDSHIYQSEAQLAFLTEAAQDILGIEIRQASQTSEIQMTTHTDRRTSVELIVLQSILLEEGLAGSISGIHASKSTASAYPKILSVKFERHYAVVWQSVSCSI